MIRQMAVIPDPIIIYLESSVFRIPDNLSDIPESLERAIGLSEGDLVYLRAPSQLMIDTPGSSTRGFTHSFYPGHVRNIKGELQFVPLTRMPSYPPGYGLDHQPGIELPLRALDQEEFYRLVTK